MEYYFISGDSKGFDEPRKCLILRRLNFKKRNDFAYVKLESPNFYEGRVLAEELILAGRLKGSNIFESDNFPLYVYVLKPTKEIRRDCIELYDTDFEYIAIGELYSSEIAALIALNKAIIQDKQLDLKEEEWNHLVSIAKYISERILENKFSIVKGALVLRRILLKFPDSIIKEFLTFTTLYIDRNKMDCCYTNEEKLFHAVKVVDVDEEKLTLKRECREKIIQACIKLLSFNFDAWRNNMLEVRNSL